MFIGEKTSRFSSLPGIRAVVLILLRQLPAKLVNEKVIGMKTEAELALENE
jgi:hypothetical protein